MVEEKNSKPNQNDAAPQTATKTQRRTANPKKESEPTVVKERSYTVKDIDPEQYVIVRNGFQGRLVYKSKRTGERFVWEAFGDEQEMTLRELKNAKNSYKKFFENNWFMFDEDWIIDYLGVGKFYKNAIRIDDFDSIFDEDAESIKKTIASLSAGQKRSVAYRARTLIAEDKIDSTRVIKALEDALDVELVDRS